MVNYAKAKILVTIWLAASPALSAFLGEMCLDDSDCAFGHSECVFRFEECEEKACWCTEDYGGRFSSSCSRELGTSERCHDRYSGLFPEVTCPPESSCDDILDSCVPHILADSDCTPGVTQCTSDASCSPATTPNKCTCESWMKIVSGRCVPYAFDETCTLGSYCDLTYDCQGTPLKCRCLNSNYTQQTFSQDNEDVPRCVHAQATTNVAVGGACRRDDVTYNGKICNAGLTCSRCLGEDAPTCITPVLGGGADGVHAGFFILSAAFLLTKLMCI